MLARPLVGVYTGETTKDKKAETVRLPAVFTTSIRPDLVNDVFNRMSRNRRQAFSVSKYAGHQTSAESWGTGRAVARIPRVPGGGTHRAGQGAFGNMCRGGRMFSPTKTWRRWHRKINVNQKRYALASAVAASAIPALVMARGHKVEQLNEIPLVVDNKVIDNVDRTKKAIALLSALGANADIEKVKNSINLRAGKGKSRNRRWRHRRGPLVIYDQKGPMVKAFRNIKGVELCSVESLNLLQFAPGGHLGRFVIWTRSAFNKLDSIFGTNTTFSTQKSGYRLPRPIVRNPDINRILRSDQVQGVLRDVRTSTRFQRKVNPLRNVALMKRLNPLSYTHRRRVILDAIARDKSRAESLQKGTKVPPTKASASKKAKLQKLKAKKNAPTKTAASTKTAPTKTTAPAKTTAPTKAAPTKAAAPKS